MLQWCMLSIMSPDLWCQWQATNDVCFKLKTTHILHSGLKITQTVSFYNFEMHHNDHQSLKYGNRLLFNGLFSKPNCDQMGSKMSKKSFLDTPSNFSNLILKKKFSVKTRFFSSKSDFSANNRPKSGQKIDYSKTNPLHLLRNFVRIPKMGDFLL